jgi:large subunit ribosomal protein L33
MLGDRSHASRRSGRLPVTLCCAVCGSRNKRTTKARHDGSEALTLKKFCKVCNRHTIHTESK